MSECHIRWINSLYFGLLFSVSAKHRILRKSLFRFMGLLFILWLSNYFLPTLMWIHVKGWLWLLNKSSFILYAGNWLLFLNHKSIQTHGKDKIKIIIHGHETTNLYQKCQEGNLLLIIEIQHISQYVPTFLIDSLDVLQYQFTTLVLSNVGPNTRTLFQ